MTETTVKDAAHTLRGNFDVRELVRQLLPAHPWHKNGAELAAPCPRCGGDDRFYANVAFAACRQCHPQRMDAAGLVAWLRGTSMAEAVRILGGTVSPVRTHNGADARRLHPADDTPSSDWRTFAPRTLERAQARLMQSRMQDAGAAYLAQRGITRDTWQAFGLGYEPARTLVSDRKQRAPAICWPVVHEDTGEVCAIRYRYCGDTVTGDRYDGMKGSITRGRLFGVQALPDYARLPVDVDSDGQHRCAEQLRGILLIEGEMNAMAAWQACHGAGVDVLSTGSESQRILPAWSVTLAMRYGCVLTWFDRPEVASTVAQQLRAHPRVQGLRSPIQDGRKVDANDMLTIGVLGALVQAARLRKLTERHERQAVLWQIWDSVDGVREALDSHTQSLVTELLAELGAEWRTVASPN